MSFPLEILRAQIYNSVEFRKPMQSAPRKVTCYEFEICTAIISPEVVTVIDGCERRLCVGDVIAAHPGQIRYTKGHFECLFIHFRCPDAEFEEKYLRGLPQMLRMPDQEHTARMFSSVAVAMAKKDSGYELYAAGRLMELISEFYSAGSLIAGMDSKYMRFSDVVMQAMDYMRQNFRENITLDELAQKVHISPSYFHMIFKRSVGMTPYQYLNEVRIKESQKLLLTTSVPLSVIADACGFESQSYFTDVFRRHTGKTPGKYRKENAAVL